MPSHFSTIGFHVRDDDHFERLASEAAEAGEVLKSPRGYYIRYTPGAGAELWVQANKQKELIGCNPHFAGTCRIRAGITKQPIKDEETFMDGSLYCWAAVTGDDPSAGFPLVIDVPDFDLVRERLKLPAIVTIQVAAFAYKLSCFADDEQFRSSQSGTMKFAADAYLPSGIFTPGLKDRDPPEAEAIFAGHILSAELRTNPSTGRRFHYLSVESLPGVFDVVADPEVVEGEPVTSGVAKGNFWLSGRIVSDLPSARDSSLLGRLFSRN